jgi:DNA-directed RNA polymerase subunit RPC12/RpoP
LPGDLRVPSFRCSACGAELATSAYVDKSIASVEQMRVYLEGLAANPRAAGARPAPRFETTNADVRPATCRHCGGAVSVPLSLRDKTFVCPTCHRTEAIVNYVTDKERFVLDMQRQMAGNRALKDLRTAGVPCHRCGAQNPIADPAAVQVVCSYCGAAILLSDHVSADAIARARLKQGLVDLRAGFEAAQKTQDRKVLILVACILGVAVAGVGIAVAVGALR